jgi:hypothetical protein
MAHAMRAMQLRISTTISIHTHHCVSPHHLYPYPPLRIFTPLRISTPNSTPHSLQGEVHLPSVLML